MLFEDVFQSRKCGGKGSDLDLCFSSKRFVNFADLFAGILSLLDSLNAKVFAMVAWSLWYKRNAL